MRSIIRTSAFATLLPLTAGMLNAQTQPPRRPLPSGAAIVQRSVEASGGSHWMRLRNYTMRGTVSMPAAALSGEFRLEASAPASFRIEQRFPSIGGSTEVFNGVSGWAKESSKQTRPLSGAELASIRRQALLALRPGDWKNIYARAETLGTSQVSHSDAFRVRLTPKSGSVETHYYDVKSGLEVREDVTADTAQGKIPVEVYPSDYRLVNGVRLPFRIREVMGPSEIVMIATEVKANAAIPASDFSAPK